jgi:hypothetical protein
MRGEHFEMLPADAAAAMVSTSIQRSVGSHFQGARSRASSGTCANAHAMTAFALICAAKGWVASMTRAMLFVLI